MRNAPALVNRAYGKSFFWDGRVATLEEQVLEPVQSPFEMNMTLAEWTARMRAESYYMKAFGQVFGSVPSAANAAKALASFVRVQRFGNSAFDRHEAGDRTALTTAARRGLALFRGRANCIACHVGPNFTDERFHNTGVSWGGPDLGRYGITRRASDRGAFKTPTLREVAQTGPYMHDGSVRTLEAVVDFYNEAKPNPYRDPEVRPLRLSTQERKDLVDFLISLTGKS
jgi:cytochrome c peroxidase